ncbi:MAG: hypothetical protein KAR35_06955 [Candidatus Heimdallarchaeota archaeon]|nr:hypothetical protein [Candidatus Heimdallarchaeota archaeon]MCK5049098.1 hypothetical protein [Candidatus Heimdallarchaeota archaeon]
MRFDKVQVSPELMIFPNNQKEYLGFVSHSLLTESPINDDYKVFTGKLSALLYETSFSFIIKLTKNFKPTIHQLIKGETIEATAQQASIIKRRMTNLISLVSENLVLKPNDQTVFLEDIKENIPKSIKKTKNSILLLKNAENEKKCLILCILRTNSDMNSEVNDIIQSALCFDESEINIYGSKEKSGKKKNGKKSHMTGIMIKFITEKEERANEILVAFTSKIEGLQQERNMSLEFMSQREVKQNLLKTIIGVSWKNNPLSIENYLHIPLFLKREETMEYETIENDPTENKIETVKVEVTRSHKRQSGEIVNFVKKRKSKITRKDQIPKIQRKKQLESSILDYFPMATDMPIPSPEMTTEPQNIKSEPTIEKIHNREIPDQKPVSKSTIISEKRKQYDLEKKENVISRLIIHYKKQGYAAFPSATPFPESQEKFDLVLKKGYQVFAVWVEGQATKELIEKYTTLISDIRKQYPHVHVKYALIAFSSKVATPIPLAHDMGISVLSVDDILSEPIMALASS